MTSIQFSESAGLSSAELASWVNAGLVVPERTGAGGRYQEFAAEQLPRVHVLKALHAKGVTLSRLARLPLDLRGRFVVFDSGSEGLRTCGDAQMAIGAVIAGKRWVCAVAIPRL